ncbi:hypothetical protein D3C76_615470 [compost metagenome]
MDRAGCGFVCRRSRLRLLHLGQRFGLGHLLGALKLRLLLGTLRPTNRQQPFKALVDLLGGALGINPPVGRPDAQDFPAQTAQHLLTELVPVTSGGTAVVGSTIALDTRQVATRRIRVDDTEVYAEGRHTHLRNHLPAPATQRVRHGFLERTVKAAETAPVGFRQRTRATLGEFEEMLEVARADGLGTRQIDLIRAQGRKHPQLMPRPGDRHVQAALTARTVDRAEVHRHMAGGIGAVGDREVHDVTLVTLHTLQVLDEHWFQLSLGKVAFQRRIITPFVVDQVFNQLLLLAVEGDHANGQAALAEPRTSQAADQVSDQGASLDRVGARPTLLVHTTDQVQADCVVGGHR